MKRTKKNMTTNEEKIKKLKSYQNSWKEIQRLADEIERLNSQAQKITQTLSSAPSGQGKSDRTVIVDKIVERKEELQTTIERAKRECAEIETAIENVKTPIYQRVLKWKYINGATFEEIAVRENYNYRYIVSKIHPEALEELKF